MSDIVKCPKCGRERKKKFAKFCEACGVSFLQELATIPQAKSESRSDPGEAKPREAKAVRVETDGISPSVKKYIKMAAFDLAIKELENELERSRTIPLLHALAMCYLYKYGNVKSDLNFSNWFTMVIGIINAVDKAIKIDKAENYISEAIEMAPEEPFLYKTLALCKYCSGNFEEALKMGRALTQEATSENEKAGFHVFVGNCFRQLGNSRAFENRLQYASYISRNQAGLQKQIEEMQKAKSMLIGGAAMLGFLLGGPLGGAIGAGLANAVQNSSDQAQFEDDDPEILEFIAERDDAIRMKEDEERRRIQEENDARNRSCLFGCATIIGLLIFLGHLAK